MGKCELVNDRFESYSSFDAGVHSVRYESGVLEIGPLEVEGDALRINDVKSRRMLLKEGADPRL
jgi:hypothetical protein